MPNFPEILDQSKLIDCPFRPAGVGAGAALKAYTAVELDAGAGPSPVAVTLS